jgi:hypothetical protein
MNILHLSVHGTDLSSRGLGAKVRASILELAEHGVAEVDFDGVLCASDSFLDEVFAVLVAEKGKDWFRDHLRLTNLSEFIREDLLSAIELRLEGPDGTNVSRSGAFDSRPSFA